MAESINLKTSVTIMGALTIVLLAAAAVINFGEDSKSGSIDTQGLDLMSYFDQTQNGVSGFTVTNIYFRTENNFLQGLYFDGKTQTFYESAGLYGESHV